MSLSLHHRDLFDHQLMAQALSEQMSCLCNDDNTSNYQSPSSDGLVDHTNCITKVIFADGVTINI